MGTALTFKDISTYASAAAGTSHTVSFPAGIADGDVLICLFGLDSATQTPALSAYPKEWVPATSSAGGAVNAATGGGMQLHAAVKNYVSGETTSVTWTTTSFSAVGVILAYSVTNYRMPPLMIDPDFTTSGSALGSPADASGIEEPLSFSSKKMHRYSGWDQYFMVGALLLNSTSGSWDHYHHRREEQHPTVPLTNRRSTLLQATGTKFGMMSVFDTNGIVTGPSIVPSYKFGFDAHASDHTDVSAQSFLVAGFTPQMTPRQNATWRTTPDMPNSAWT